MQHRIDLLWKAQENTRKTVDKTRIEDLRHFHAYAATLGITQKKVFILDLSPTTMIPDSELKKFKGVEMQILPSDQVKSLVIILLEDSLFTTFGYLIDDIINGLLHLSKEDDAVKKVFKIIRQWRRLFEKLQVEGLSIEEQKGLYGELLIIKLLFENGVAPLTLIRSWCGPDKKNHDFSFRSLVLEVKTTVANHPVIRISNEHQLQNPSILCLILIVLNEKIGNQNTLPVLVNEIKAILNDYSECLEMFEEKLALVNYLELDSDKYSHTEYSIREISAYNVSDDFPRITPENILEGIFTVAYQIATSACSRYLVDFPDFILDNLSHENSSQTDTH